MGAACAISTVAQTPEALSRNEFLQVVDRALTARDAEKLASLADADSRRASGRETLDRRTLWLPPTPIVRKRDLSANEVVYEDGEGNSWRLRLRRRDDRGDWSVVVLNRPCPPKSMPRGRPWEDKQGADGAAPSGDSQKSGAEIWTPLECYPLPR
jgi:hypothetical protein